MNSITQPLVSLLLATLSIVAVPCCHAESSGGIAGPIADGLSALVPPIVAAFGSADVTMELYRYEYKTTTSYRGVNSAATWVAKVSNTGTTSYSTHLEMSGIDSKLDTISTAPFSIRMGSPEGDVPFSLRSHKCVMPFGEGEFFTATTDAKITFKTTHRYKTNPAFMALSTDAKIYCSEWTRERSNCGEVSGRESRLFICPIVNNGISFPSIPNGQQVNLTHLEGAGLGITW
jgi:hypothetical protein